jgi:regulator of protease activity HflC (stomatin/prohibitin superfamily)
MIAVYVIVVLVLLLLLLGLALSVRIIKQYERVVLFEVGQGQGQNGQRLPS